MIRIAYVATSRRILTDGHWLRFERLAHLLARHDVVRVRLFANASDKLDHDTRLEHKLAERLKSVGYLSEFAGPVPLSGVDPGERDRWVRAGMKDVDLLVLSQKAHGDASTSVMNQWFRDEAERRHTTWAMLDDDGRLFTSLG